jgi:hypothetical protein
MNCAKHYEKATGKRKVARSATGILVSKNTRSLFRVPLRIEGFGSTTTRDSARAQRGHCAHVDDSNAVWKE